MRARAVIASSRAGVATELAAANGAGRIVGHARTRADTEAALGALRPSVLVRLAAHDFERRRDGDGLTLRERDGTTK